MNIKHSISKHHIVVLSFTLFFFCWVGFDILHHDGMVGVTKRGPDPYGCICHGTNTPTDSILVFISGPETVYVGSSSTYTLTMMGGPAVAGGFNLSVGSGEVYAVDTTTQRMQNFLSKYELTHTEPKPFTGNSVTWQFTYTAAGNPGRDTMYSVGNSINFNSDPTGDQYNDGIDFIVTIVESVKTAQYHVDEKWNLVSLPLSIDDRRKSAIFPDAVSNAYGFTLASGYQTKDTLNVGTGYWLKFSASDNITLTGLPVTEISIPVTEGWNIIGAINQTIAASAITSTPGGIVTSQFYGYSNGYLPGDSLKPSKGYWVKVNQAGVLHLSSNTVVTSSQRIAIIATDELPPSPPGVGDQQVQIPGRITLDQNYPNPFNPSTKIRYRITEPGPVTLKIYSILGNEVAVLVQAMQMPGEHIAEWNADAFSGGIYMCRLTTGNGTESRKLLLLK